LLGDCAENAFMIAYTGWVPGGLCMMQVYVQVYV
jgi:hypothetical protein